MSQTYSNLATEPKELFIETNVASLSVSSTFTTSNFAKNLASATVWASDPNSKILHMFQNSTGLKYLNLAELNVTSLGASGNNSYGIAGLKSISSLETLILPKTMNNVRGEICKTCVNPIYIPDVPIFEMDEGIYGYVVRNLNQASNVHLIIGENTTLHFTGGVANYASIYQSSNIKLTFLGDHIQTRNNAIVAQGSTITVEYHSSRGEWADPSFKENSALWGTLTQYTWVDLDAQP
jgi:hypothetical protein